MLSYLIPIQTALVLFPILAALITVPYVIHQYRVYGAVLVLRVAIVYSFIFYLLCSYFLTMLPLPPIEEVRAYSGAVMQLVPFQAIKDLIASSSTASLLQIFSKPAFYQIAFNILLLMPLGIYLRYYFTYSWKKVLLISFLVSLSFECIQLSALFGIYPRPYRLFDVDDLIANTIGGILGYLITPIFAYFLPSRKQLDEISYHKGEQVSAMRRCMAAVIDLLCAACLYAVLAICGSGFLRYGKARFLMILYLLVFAVYFLLIPMITKGATIGKRLVKIYLVNKENKIPRFYQYLFHFSFYYIFLFPVPLLIWHLIKDAFLSGAVIQFPYLILSAVLGVYFVFMLLFLITSLFTKDGEEIYQRWFHMHNQSSIQKEFESTKKKPIEDTAVQDQ